MTAVLDLELTTLYVRTADGRLERERRASASAFFPPPLVAVAAGADGLVWACGSALPAATVDEVAALLRTEARRFDASGVPEVGWSPSAADAILTVLPRADARRVDRGPSYVAPVGHRAEASLPGGVEVRTSADTDLDDVRRLLPERDVVLDPPWVLALVDGEAAAVCETARSAPSSVEAGVWTYEAHRRRGLATAVTATWLGLVTPDRTAFYSTSADNAGSQGVASRLGLTPVGQWWQVR